MNPPWPRRTVLTRTALLAPGRTTTSPALTSPAKTTSSTDDDNTARDDRLHPQCKHEMYGMCTKGKAGRPTGCLVDPAIPCEQRVPHVTRDWAWVSGGVAAAQAKMRQ